MKRWLITAMLIINSGAGGAMEAEIEQWETANGSKVLFVARHELPIVDVRIAFAAGSARDGSQAGLARLTNQLVLDGTSARDAGEIARHFERYGARVSTNSGRDTAEVSLRALSEPERLDPVIDNLANALANANFPADAVARVRQQMRLGLEQAQSSPSALAEQAFAEGIYADHPYATPPGGSLESVPQLTREAVVTFHRRHYTASNATIAIVGDLETSAAKTIAEQLSGGLPVGEALAPLPEVKQPTSAQTIRVPFQAEQTHVLIGQPSVRRGDPAYYALYMGNHMLGGGGLSSLLAERMREERGLSYSSSSQVTTGARRGRFQMGTQVRNDALGEALEVLRTSLGELQTQGPSSERLEASRRNITGSFPLQLDSNRDLLGYVSSIGFHDLPHDYLQQFVDRIEALDDSSVQNALRDHLELNRMTTVLVGPEAIINAVE
ncbi:MAG: pitrilysin family protein [Spiribacter sp.]|jgi:zinc protease|nr:pitrilysin family protein [Spiribacter sp.]MDR9488759.1 pitrilysin family protein [Spiribacter sp.]